MTLRIAAIVFLLAVNAASQAAPPVGTPLPNPAQISPVTLKLMGDYGRWWKGISEESRDNFVDGYTTAMQKAQIMTHNECMKNARNVQPGPGSNARLQESLNLCVLSHAFDYKAALSFRAGLDGFYKDPLNARIPPEFAMEYLRDDFNRDKTPNQLLDELIEWRRMMNTQ
jgi:hypothetical protein